MTGRAFVEFVVPPDGLVLRWGVWLGAAAALAAAALLRRRLAGRDPTPALRWLYSNPVVGSLRAVMAVGLVVVAAECWLGPASAGLNPGAAALWGLWWPALAFLPFFIGRGFCAVCPVMALGAWRRSVGGLRLRLPGSLARAGFLPAALVFLAFGAANHLFLIEQRPWAAARFIVLMLAAVVVLLLVFEEWVWCSRLCPVGAIQASLARFAWLRASPKPPPQLCRLGLAPDSPEPLCSFCGDCWRGGGHGDAVLGARPSSFRGEGGARPPAFAVRQSADPAPLIPGELLLMSVLLAHVLFELLTTCDPVRAYLLQVERAMIVYVPLGAPPPWTAGVPLSALLAGGTLLAAAAVAGLRPLLAQACNAESSRLAPGTADRFGAAQLPLVASAYAGFHLPSVWLAAPVLRRFLSLLAGGAWSDLPILQGAEFPAGTSLVLRLSLLAVGLHAAWRSLDRVRESLEDSPALHDRLLAERLYALLIAAGLTLLYLAPNTQADPC